MSSQSKGMNKVGEAWTCKGNILKLSQDSRIFHYICTLGPSLTSQSKLELNEQVFTQIHVDIDKALKPQESSI